ncbi:hypothetical protein ACGFIY_26125 [Micromonospora chersina]
MAGWLVSDSAARRMCAGGRGDATARRFAVAARYPVFRVERRPG